MKVDITQRILFGLLNAWERKAYCIVDLSDFDLENIYYHSKVEVDRIQERLVAALRMRLSEDFPDSVVFDLLMSKINHLRDLGKLVLLCRLKSFDTCSVMRNNLRLQKNHFIGVHHDKIHDILRYNPSGVKIPALYSEIYYLEHRAAPHHGPPSENGSQNVSAIAHS